MGKNKNKKKSRDDKIQKSGQQTSQSGAEPSSLRSSISGVTTATNIKAYDGTADTRTSSMTSYAPNVEANQEPKSKEQLESLVPPRPRSRWWKRWMPRPCGWWPCRTCRWIRDFIAAVFRLVFTQYWLDLLYTLGLAIAFAFSCWVAIEGLMHILKPVAAQDADCSVVYVTIPGPIITVSLIGATPSDPNHGTYYYSVINGTTHWMNSIAPPTRFSTLITTTPGVTTTPPAGLPSASGRPPTTPGLSTTSGIQPSSPPPPLRPSGPPPGPPTSPMTSPAPGTSVVSAIISGSTTIVTLSGSLPTRPSPTFPLPPATSNTPPQSGVPSFSVTGSSGAIGQPPPSQPPPVVVTRTLTGPSGRLTTTATMTNGPNMPSSLAMPPGVSQSLPVPSASTPITSSPGTIPSSSLGSAINPPGTPGLSTTPGTLPPTSPPTSAAQSAPGAPSIPPVSSPSTTVLTITSIASDGQTQTITRSSVTFVSRSVPLLPSSAIMSQPTSPPSSGAVSTSPNTESTRFTVSLPTPSSPSGFTTTTFGSPPAFMSTVTRVTSGPSPPGSSPASSAPTVSASIPTTPGQPSLPASSLPSSQPILPSDSARPSSTASVPTTPSASSAPSFIPTSLPNSSRLSSTGGQPISLSTLSKTSPSPSSGQSTAPSSGIGGTSSPLGSIGSSVSRPATGSTSTPASSPSVSAPSSFARPSSPSGSTVTLTNSLSTLITTQTSSFTVPSSRSLSTPAISTQSPLPPSSTPVSSSTTTVTSPGVPTMPSPPVFVNTTSSLNLTSTSSSSLSNSATSMSFSSALSSSPTSLIPSSLMASSGSSMASSTSGTSSIARSSSSTILSTLFTTSFDSSATYSVSRSSTATVPSSSGSAVLPSASSSPAITTFSSSPSPAPTPPPSDAWSGTALPINCSGSPDNPECGPGMAAFTTKVIAFGKTKFSFVFPQPSITTTVSYWTGTYPTLTGPDWTSLPQTTRTLRQTPLSELPSLPSFELFKSTPSRSSFKTIVQTVVKPWAAKPTETKIAARQESVGPAPALCGEYGNFTLNFDDSTVSEGDGDILPVAGMQNPYHHLFYANGFTYVPDKWEPYPAISQPNVAMFLPIGSSLLPNSPFAGTLLPGEFGAGPRASIDAYWFNAHSGYFGCALNGITPCTLRISGYRYDATLEQEVLAAEQSVTIPPCWGYINCQLTQVVFDAQFTRLSGIQFNAFTYNLGIPQIFMMDDLQLEWWNNTCSAGILRIGHNY